MREWKKLTKKIIDPINEIKVGFVGKYGSQEAYKSLLEGLIHAGAWSDTKVTIIWVDSEDVKNITQLLAGVDAILVPGGFGERGIDGKLEAIKYARENNIVFLGICLGMQLSLIEFARNVLNIKNATSQEFDKDTNEPVIYLIDEFIDGSGAKQIRTHTTSLGGTMRLGEYECNIKKDTKLHKAYSEQKVKERHRHRYEANPKYKNIYEEHGMIVSGASSGLIEAIELKEHPWFVAVQYHPEFTSRLQNPNKIIAQFVKKALEFKQ